MSYPEVDSPPGWTTTTDLRLTGLLVYAPVLGCAPTSQHTYKRSSKAIQMHGGHSIFICQQACLFPYLSLRDMSYPEVDSPPGWTTTTDFRLTGLPVYAPVLGCAPTSQHIYKRSSKAIQMHGGHSIFICQQACLFPYLSLRE
ncbi:unnamed protein product [Protopolystoma xenopodis]|uniref:Uncharacterized protein n=1 Tax=Protopolystoma xenopodis TaxID=117903 RepID=A0A448XDH7_9PLAT|nr:unnamed protein product [Protopolystoma xenopodis]